MKYVLGLSCHYHDAAAALLGDGVLLAAADEERFSRRKHDSRFPEQAIAYCLRTANIAAGDLDLIAFYEKPFVKFERILHQHLDHFPKSWKTFLQAIPPWLGEKLRVESLIRKKLGYRGDIVFSEHHLSHAASAFYPSPFDKAAILTVDGVGEWATTSMGRGEGNAITLDKEIHFPHSIGLLYSTLTAYLGFTVNNGEYKVMGLAPYGDQSRTGNAAYRQLQKVIFLAEDGGFALTPEYFLFEYRDRMPSERLCALLGGPIRHPREPLIDRHHDIAAALQLITEDAVLNLARNLRRRTGLDNLVLAGGVALNSVCNGKILPATGFKDIWIQPNAGDGGSSLGAAAFAWHHVLGNPRNTQPSPMRMSHAFWGPGYSPQEAAAWLQEQGIVFHRFKDKSELITNTCERLSQGQVLGWFQGRMEWGPRALGGRSILANPGDAAMRDILNGKVKHREHFRPFAPAIPRDDAATFFECDDPLPEPADYMLMVYPVRPRWRDKLPAITHVDGSARLQTVRREQHELYYDLLKAFGRLTGMPILVNTSFNIRGEPMVCTPEDAFRCMMGTGIDALVLEDCLVIRAENPSFAWDSEADADD